MINRELKDSKFDIFKTGYIDESGDCGIKGSSCLVLTYICLDERKKIYKIMKKMKEALGRTKKGQLWLNRKGGEIKFNSFPDKNILFKTLEELAKLKFEIMFRAFKKDKKDIHSSEKDRLLYDLLIESLVNRNLLPKNIIADKDYFKNKKIVCLAVRDYVEEFYLDGKGSELSFRLDLIDEDEYKKESENFDFHIFIKHENSKSNIGLQVVDIISGAIFQEIEHQDKTYTNLIRKHTKIEGGIITPIK